MFDSDINGLYYFVLWKGDDGDELQQIVATSMKPTDFKELLHKDEGYEYIDDFISCVRDKGEYIAKVEHVDFIRMLTGYINGEPVIIN
jgi:hypothetical protein